MRSWSRCAVGLAALLLIASPALAQQRGGRQGFGGGFGGFGGQRSGVMLLGMPAVQEELKLSDEQRDKVQEVVEAARSKMQGMREKLQDLSQEERREKGRELMAEINTESEKSLEGVLKPDQKKRLDQIVLQTSGPEAFGTEKVQAGLDLSDEQKTKVGEILEAAATERREAMQGAQGQGDFQAMRSKMQSIREESMKKITALLSEEQTTKWKELTGEPFEMPAFGPGGRGPGGRPGGRRQGNNDV